MNPRLTFLLGLLTVILFTAALGGDLYGEDKPKEKPAPKAGDKPAPKAEKKPAKAAPAAKGAEKKPAGKPAPKGTEKKPDAKPVKAAAKPPKAKTPPQPAPPGPKKAPEPKKPAFEPRDVPEPLVPEIDDVPPGFQPETWQSWVTGQEITTPGRFTINLFFGITLLQNDGMAGNGTDAPSYSDLFSDSPGPLAGAELGFTLMPVLNLSIGYLFTLRSGEENWHDNEGDYVLAGWHEAIWDDLETHYFSLNIKFKVPLLVWKLRSSHLRFTQATEITGPVFFVRAGIGAANLSSVSIELYRDTPFGGEGQEQSYYDDTANVSWNLGAGIELRWDWGGVLFQFTMHNFGTPAPSVPMAESEAYTAMGLALAFGLYL